MYKGQVPDRLTLRLPKELWAVMRKLRERWGLSNEEVVRRLIADEGEKPQQAAPMMQPKFTTFTTATDARNGPVGSTLPRSREIGLERGPEPRKG